MNEHARVDVGKNVESAGKGKDPVDIPALDKENPMNQTVGDGTNFEIGEFSSVPIDEEKMTVETTV
jgi:hypothetical protein